MSDQETPRQRRDSLIRMAAPVADAPVLELRADGDNSDQSGKVLSGNFLVFDQWTEIKSSWEGNFMERFAPGSVKKTIREQRDRMKVLFQHGQDPQIGDKPLGSIRELRETDEGAYYEVDLLDTEYVREIVPGLEANLYGASFRFSVVREEINDEPGPSEHNPLGLPERTIKEAKVAEFGPVTFPAYAGASAGLRSMTDEFLHACFRSDPERLEEMFEEFRSGQVSEEPAVEDAPSDDDAAANEPHLSEERRETEPVRSTRGHKTHLYGVSQKERRPSWTL